MKVLLIVDVQNDFLPGGALAVPNGDQIIPVINRIQPYFDAVIATQDWHPPQHVSFADNYDNRKPGDLVEHRGALQILWPRHCVQGSHGADFANTLDLKRIRHIFQKGCDPMIDSYSGFFDNNRQRGTGLDESLQQLGTTELFVCGLATDYCVKWSVLDACSLGYNTFVVTDACKGVNLSPNDEMEAYEEMREAGAEIVQSTLFAVPG